MDDFNIQTELRNIRTDSWTQYNLLASKFDKMDERVNGHETRIVVVEQTRKYMIASVGTIFAAAISGFVTWMFGSVGGKS